MRRIIVLSFALVFLLILIGGAAFVFSAGSDLPPKTDETIKAVLTNPLPEIVRGETGYARSQGWRIWYERLHPDQPVRGTVLLMMGISNDALGWPPTFLDALVDAGYEVIRYDHRGTGLSDWSPGPDAAGAYSLTDMAHDGVAVLDALNVERAHVIGISLGGMIAQEFAIRHGDRTASLTSMMSSSHIEDPDLPPVSTAVVIDLVRVALRYGLFGGERNQVKLHIASRQILMGEPYELDVGEIAQHVLYNLRERNGYNHHVSREHQEAVRRTGSRSQALQSLDIPTLVIHGKADPFIPIEHGEKTAELIPDAIGLWVEGLGHDLPDHFVKPLVNAMVENFERRGR